MAGKTVVVTGANSGIGLETTRGLAAMGAHVVMACRDASRAESARADVAASVEDASLAVAALDLSDPESIEAFAATCPPTDVLVNNAGVWTTRRRESKEGLELTFAVNALGTFRLTQALLPKIRDGTGRVVTVASLAHLAARPDWDDLQMESSFDGSRQYCNSKLYTLWFSDVLSDRLAARGITCNALHPGSGISNLQRDMGQRLMRVARPLLKSPTTLAKTSIRLASDPSMDGVTGGYFHGRRRAKRSRLAKDPVAALRLWRVLDRFG